MIELTFTMMACFCQIGCVFSELMSFFPDDEFFLKSAGKTVDFSDGLISPGHP